MSQQEELNDTLVMTNLDKKEVSYTLGTGEQSLEHTVGLVNSVAQINILAEINLTGTSFAESDVLEPIAWIKAVPSGKVPALDLSGLLAMEIMKGKFDGKALQKTVSGTTGITGKYLYSFDFRDYMGVWPLGIPEGVKDLYIKLTIPTLSGIITGGTVTSGTVTVTIQVLMDESCNGSIGYRQYLENAEGFDSKDSNKGRKLKLPQSGFLDSILIYNPDSATLPISEIEVIKDVTEYPVKSTLALEQMKASLINAEFSDGVTYIDLVRPIDAQSARSLDLHLICGTVTSGTIRIVKEYVHIDPALLAY